MRANDFLRRAGNEISRSLGVEMAMPEASSVRQNSEYSRRRRVGPFWRIPRASRAARTKNMCN